MLIAEDRAGRPNDFVEPSKVPDSGSSHGDCPFCVGHEGRTPEALLEVCDADGSWQVRVVPNKYPAVSLEVAATETGPFGTHEVIIESPRHVQDITELSPEEFACVLRVYRQRLRDWSSDERIRHVSIFKNVGVAAGASLEHAHSQLVALPTVPRVVADELSSCQRFLAEHGSRLYCQLIADELASGQRIVIDDGPFVAFCAVAGRQPYETWILPRQHQASFEQTTDDDLDSLASVLQRLIAALQTQLSPLSYNLILHTAPFDPQLSDAYHWHFELVPRSTQLAGFEWGTGMHINPLAPERAAARLMASFR